MSRMKAVATTMFLLALAGALITWRFQQSFTGGLLFAACEAALVGALADWFAVVALFRHPLGLKFIPHTAIIPNNRDRIIEGITAIVEKDWLSLDFIKSKINDYPIVDGLATALASEAGRGELERLARSLVINTLETLRPEDAAHFIQLILEDHLDEIRISPQLLEQVEISVKKLYADDIIRLILNWAIGVTRGEEFERAIRRTLSRAASDYSNQGNLLRRLGKGIGESLDIVNYDEAAATLSHRIHRFLVEMKEPDNRYHVKMKTELQNLTIADPEEAASMLSVMLKNVVGSEAGARGMTELLRVFKTQILNGDAQEMPVIRFLVNMIGEQINLIRQDEERKASLDALIKTEIINLLERYHGVIGLIVKEKLESLDDSGLVMSLEAKVGDDLQWIRVNGTVIGALVGILQYLVLHLM